MPELGNKLECFECGTKFSDLGRSEPLCPKCGTDQRRQEETSSPTPTRLRGTGGKDTTAVEEDNLTESLEEDESKGPAEDLEEENLHEDEK